MKVKVLVAQSWPTLCDLMDCSSPESFVHGISQARILEGVAIPFSRQSSRPMDWIYVSLIACRFFTIWVTRNTYIWGFPSGSDGKGSAWNEWGEAQVRSLGQDNLPETKMTIHSSILARRILRTEEPGGLQSMQLQKIGRDWAISRHR